MIYRPNLLVECLALAHCSNHPFSVWNLLMNGTASMCFEACRFTLLWPSVAKFMYWLVRNMVVIFSQASIGYLYYVKLFSAYFVNFTSSNKYFNNFIIRFSIQVICILSFLHFSNTLSLSLYCVGRKLLGHTSANHYSERKCEWIWNG